MAARNPPVSLDDEEVPFEFYDEPRSMFPVPRRVKRALTAITGERQRPAEPSVRRLLALSLWQGQNPVVPLDDGIPTTPSESKREEKEREVKEEEEPEEEEEEEEEWPESEENILATMLGLSFAEPKVVPYFDWMRKLTEAPLSERTPP